MRLRIKELERATGVEPVSRDLPSTHLSRSASPAQYEGDVSAFPSSNSAFFIDRN
jgi:hypothetical protein